MIVQHTSFLIPSGVVGGHFPRADEDGLRTLAGVWKDVAAQTSAEGDKVTSLSRGVAAAWTGTAADAASARMGSVAAFSASLSGAATTVSAGCSTAASYVTNVKKAINVVLIALENATKQQLLAGAADLLHAATYLANIIRLRERAHAIIASYYEALTEAMGSIRFTTTISPRPKAAAGTGVLVASGTTAGTSTASYEVSSGAGGGAGVVSGSGTAAVPVATATPSPLDAVLSEWSGDFAPVVTTAADTALIAAAVTPPAKPTSDTKTTEQDSSTTETKAQGTDASQGKPADSSMSNDLSSLTEKMGAPDTTTPPAQGADSTAGSQPAPTTETRTWTPSKSEAMDVVLGNESARTVQQNVTASLSHVVHAPVTHNDAASTPPSSGQQNGSGSGSSGSGGSGGSGSGGSGTGAGSGGSGSAGSGGAQGASVAPTADSVKVQAAGVKATAEIGSVAPSAVPAGTGAAGSAALVEAPVVPVGGAAPAMGTGMTGGGITNIQIGANGPTIQVGSGGLSSPLGSSVGGSSPLTSSVSSPLGSSSVGGTSAPLSSNATPAPSTGSLNSSTGSAPAPAAQGSGTSQSPAGPSVNSAAPLRTDAARAVVPGAEPSESAVMPVAAAIATLGLVGVAAQHFAGLWGDLRASSAVLPAGAVLPTQFGRHGELLAAMPWGMDTVYQKVLLPGEADQLISGQVDTIRGLVYPFQAVRHLQTPAQLYDALGLGFAVTNIAGSDTLAFARDAESVDVLRCAGVRVDDLVTPVDTDVVLPAGTVPAPLVRHHLRPWTGTGEAPGSTSDTVIDEHEILGYASVAVPHLAEIWRLHADGREEYVSTFNQRNGQWVGSNSPVPPAVGRRIDNGSYAELRDGTVHRSVVLTEQHSVLIAYGVSSPEHFQQAYDGSHRLTVANADIVALTGVTTIGAWRSLPVQLLHRQGDMILVDYAGDDPAAAAAAGFLQVNQGQWSPRWVEHASVTDVQELERAYPLPGRGTSPYPEAVERVPVGAGAEG